MPACLVQLPSELLLQILEHIVVGPRATPTLASLCLTARRLRSLAEPYLYAAYSNENHIDKPHLFPLSLIRRPALAEHVRKIDLQTPVRHIWCPMTEDALRQLRNIIDDLDLPQPLATECKTVLASYTSVYLPRVAVCTELTLILASWYLESLSLQLSMVGHFSQMHQETHQMIKHIMLHTPNWSGMFENLRFVFISFSPISQNMELYGLAHFFKMPSLRHFEIIGCREKDLGRSHGWNGHGELQTNLGSWQLVHNSNVESIVLRQSDISHYVLNALLNCCRAVKHLHVEVDLPKHEWVSFKLFRLQDALSRHAQSLEHLAIVQDLKNKDLQNEPGFRGSGPLEFLPHLYNLRSAVVPLCTMAAIPDVGSSEIIVEEGGWSGILLDEAEIRRYLPPSPESISICNDNLYYGNTGDLFRFV